jgi:hypothetical protein
MDIPSSTEFLPEKIYKSSNEFVENEFRSLTPFMDEQVSVMIIDEDLLNIFQISPQLATKQGVVWATKGD